MIWRRCRDTCPSQMAHVPEIARSVHSSLWERARIKVCSEVKGSNPFLPTYEVRRIRLGPIVGSRSELQNKIGHGCPCKTRTLERVGEEIFRSGEADEDARPNWPYWPVREEGRIQRSMSGKDR